MYTPSNHSGDTPAELYKRGIECLGRQSWEEAIAAFRGVIQIEPGHEKAWQKLEEAKREFKKFEDMKDLYRKGKAHFDQGQWEAAAACLRLITSSGEQCENATGLLAEAVKQLKLQTLYTNAEVWLQEQKWEEAIATLEEVVGIDQTYRGDSYNKLRRARAQYRLQSLYEQVLDHFREEEWPQAMRKLRAILRKDPDYPDAADRLKEARRRRKLAALYRDGIGFQGTSRWEEAIEQFTEIIRLARVYKFGKYKDVVDRLAGVQRQQELDKRFKQGETYRRQGKWEEAVKEFRQVHEMDPNYRGVQAKLVECNKRLRLKELCAQEEASARDKDWPKVVEVLEELHELVPEDVSIITRLGEAKRQHESDRLYREAMKYIQKKRWRKAKVALEQVIRLDPGNLDAADQLENVRRCSARIDLHNPFVQWGIGILVGIIAVVISLIQILPFTTATPTPKPTALCNGDFEKRNFECWQHGGELRQDVECDEGQCYAVLGSPRYMCKGGVPVGEAWIEQSFRVPQTVSPTLSLRYRVLSYDLVSADFFQVIINGTPVGPFGNEEWHQSSCDSEVWDSGWQDTAFDLSPYRGEMVEVYLRNVNGKPDKWWNTWTYVDDVEVH